MPHAQALKWYEQARAAAAAAGDTAGVARACKNLEACYNSMGQHAQALAWNEHARAAGDTAGFGRGPRIWNTRDCMLLQMRMHGNMHEEAAPPPPAGVDYASAPEAGAAYGSRSVTPELVRTNNGTLVFSSQNPADAFHGQNPASDPILPPVPGFPRSDEDAPGDPEEPQVVARRGDPRPLVAPGKFPDWFEAAKQRGT